MFIGFINRFLTVFSNQEKSSQDQEGYDSDVVITSKNNLADITLDNVLDTTGFREGTINRRVQKYCLKNNINIRLHDVTPDGRCCYHSLYVLLKAYNLKTDKIDYPSSSQHLKTYLLRYIFFDYSLSININSLFLVLDIKTRIW